MQPPAFCSLAHSDVERPMLIPGIALEPRGHEFSATSSEVDFSSPCGHPACELPAKGRNAVYCPQARFASMYAICLARSSFNRSCSWRRTRIRSLISGNAAVRLQHRGKADHGRVTLSAANTAFRDRSGGRSLPTRNLTLQRMAYDGAQAISLSCAAIQIQFLESSSPME
jgi:hypothetical protein